MSRILVVEDNREVSALLALHLRDAGHEVEIAFDGRAGLELALSRPHDLVVLDLMLPSLDGMEICRRLRSRPDYTPILMLTARSTELDRVLGLELGSDDYVTKPFGIRELLARVRALLRRCEAIRTASEVPPERIVAADLEIDLGKRRVRRGARRIELTAKEFDLLVHFAQNPGRVYSRSQLLELVWGYDHQSYEHTVNTHINRLRTKVEDDPSRPRFVRTVWGVGYRFFDPTDDEAP